MIMCKLLSALILHNHNFKVLHWNVCGSGFDNVHKLMGDYYEKLEGYIDEVAEACISMGCTPVNLFNAIECLKECEQNFTVVDDKKTYSCEEALKTADNILRELLSIYDEINEDQSVYVAILAKLQEHQYWMKIEVDYKGKRRMGM